MNSLLGWCAGLAAAVLLIGGLAMLTQPDPPLRPSQEARPIAGRIVDDPSADLLREWDADRAGCWARSDAACLRLLYAEGSPAGEADVALLRRWDARGVVVREMTRQVLALRSVRSPQGTRVLRVTDRLAGGVVQRERAWGRLPASAARTRVLVFRWQAVRGESRWRLDDVRPG